MAKTESDASFAFTLEAIYGPKWMDLEVWQNPERRQNIDKSFSEELESYERSIRYCQNCVLHIGRRELVFGKGPTNAKIAFVGDFPSHSDDKNGAPFSDEIGELLQKMILAMQLKSEDVYLTNLFKCRPPAGQVLSLELFSSCENHLEKQFQWVGAPVVVALGDLASKALARADAPLRVLRKQNFLWKDRSLYCTHHPRDLLSSPEKKKESWQDLQIVMKTLEKKCSR